MPDLPTHRDVTVNPEPAAGEERATPDRLTRLLDESFSGEATTPPEHEASSQAATELGDFREQLEGLSQKADDLATRQHQLEEMLAALPDQLTDKVVTAMLADREEVIAWVTGESHRLHDQLTALIRGEVANRASGQQELEERLASRQDEALERVEASSQAQHEAIATQLRDETQALVDELGGAVRDTTATLDSQQQAIERRLADRQSVAASQLVEKLSVGLLAPLSEVRTETRELNEQLQVSLLERIDTIAEEHRQFRARLAAAARLVESRFEEVIKQHEVSLGAIERQLEGLGRAARRAAAPVTKKVAKPALKNATKPRTAKKPARPAVVAKKKKASGPTPTKRTRR
ncbi:MAG TPA: hypothetical protein VM121_10775 [Acidimicrobiales bacterium]|nr:hypothetical protein [Acidimicrobiales bacterium]